MPKIASSALILLILLVAGCARPQEIATDSPDADGVVINDAVGDVHMDPGFPGTAPPLDITRLIVLELENELHVTFELQAAPDPTHVSYQCAMRDPEDRERAGGQVGARGTGPAGVSSTSADKTFTLILPYGAIAPVTHFPAYELICYTESLRANTQAVDKTEWTLIKWNVVRSIPSGIGPWYQRTKAFEDPCCDQDELTIRQAQGRSHPPGDLRNGWVWQDSHGLWVEVNATEAQTGIEYVSVRYPTPRDANGVRWSPEIIYRYDTKEVRKAGQATNATARETDINGVRLHLPWPMLADREHPAKILLSISIFSETEGSVLADGAPQVIYRVK